MPYHITIANKEDYEYLKAYLVQWRERSQKKIAAYVEHADKFERLAEAFEQATKEADPNTPTPAKKKRRTKAQKEALLPKLCPDHKSYSGVQAPRSACESCWQAYKKYSGDAKYQFARTKFERKQSTNGN